MAQTWMVSAYNDRMLSMLKECPAPVEFGRQSSRAGEELFHPIPQSEGGCRLAIAPIDDLTISRRHARVEPVDSERVLVQNISEKNTISFEDGFQLRPGREREVTLPVVLKLGVKVLRVESTGPREESTLRLIQSLEEPTLVPGAESRWARSANLNLEAAGTVDSKGVFDWLRVMIRVLQSAATDTDFFQKGAQAIVEVVGLDMGRVLTRDGDDWKTASFFPLEEEEYERTNPPSRMVLSRVIEEKKVTWFDPMKMDEDCSSLAGVTSVVAAPVRDRAGEVIAILYGERRLQALMTGARPVSRLEAMVLEVLAVGLAGGLARLEQEHAALALQTQFEQFFTPELARSLAEHPELLNGRDMEITVLFCDIHGFSRITRKQPPAFTMEWIQDVLSTISECVLSSQGVLVDYIGDEVMAMWGAPTLQPDHAERACYAALDMIAALKCLDERWRDRLGEPMGLGIGINTGIARVGNTGSRRKFKYGPLGDTVNVASRVQGAAKYFKSSLVVTRATRDRLGQEFQLRRLGAARVVNISDPIELFELFPPNQPDASAVIQSYEEALTAFENREFLTASTILGRLVSSHRTDGPSFALLARAIAYYVDQPETFDPAFRLPGK